MPGRVYVLEAVQLTSTMLSFDTTVIWYWSSSALCTCVMTLGTRSNCLLANLYFSLFFLLFFCLFYKPHKCLFWLLNLNEISIFLESGENYSVMCVKTGATKADSLLIHHSFNNTICLWELKNCQNILYEIWLLTLEDKI